MREFKQGRYLLVRLDHGADIVEQMSDLLDKEKIEAAAFCAIGALAEAEIAYATRYPTSTERSP
jgi:predicted DNA-binding protein with PD1-like motif